MTTAHAFFQTLRASKIADLARWRLALVSIMACALLQACAAPALNVSYESKPEFDIANYQSFEIKSLAEPGAEYVTFLNNGIAKTLGEKGLQKATEGDLVVLYDVDVEEGRRLHDEAIPVKNMVYTRTTVQAKFDATILVNVVDVKTNKVVWKATSTRDLTQTEPGTFNQERADLRMQELFEDFPAK